MWEQVILTVIACPHSLPGWWKVPAGGMAQRAADKIVAVPSSLLPVLSLSTSQHQGAGPYEE